MHGLGARRAVAGVRVCSRRPPGALRHGLEVEGGFEVAGVAESGFVRAVDFIHEDWRWRRRGGVRDVKVLVGREPQRGSVGGHLCVLCAMELVRVVRRGHEAVF